MIKFYSTIAGIFFLHLAFLFPTKAQHVKFIDKVESVTEQTVTGLSGTFSVTVSSDGEFVYVSSMSDRAVTVFQRDQITGTLTLVSVYKNGEDGVEGLQGSIFEVAVSPDGNHLYAGTTFSGITVFSRDPVTGTLTYTEDVGSQAVYSLEISSDGNNIYSGGFSSGGGVRVYNRNTITGGLAVLETVPVSNSVSSIKVSPDENYVYVTSSMGITSNNVDSVYVFERDESTGSLNLLQKFGNNSGAGINGLNFATDLVIAPDGKHVYVTAGQSNSIITFSRDGNTGLLIWQETLTEGDNGITGLAEAMSLEINSTGDKVYVASNSGAVVVFERDIATGGLIWLETKKENEDGVSGIDGANGLALSPDDKYLYVTGLNSNSATTFESDENDGSLAFIQTIKNGDTWTESNGLNEANFIMIGSGGKHVYVINDTENSISLFNRHPQTGALTFKEIYKDGEGGITGMTGAYSGVITSDDEYLVVSSVMHHTLVVFDRDVSTGELTFLSSYSDSNTQLPLNMVSSKDAKNVYFSSWGSLNAFSLDPLIGALTFIESYTETGTSLASIVVSPDDKYVYTAARSQEAIAIFERNSLDGSLSYVTSIQYEEGENPLEGIMSMTISPDGKFIYTVSPNGLFHTFSRDENTGMLSFSSSLSTILPGTAGDIKISNSGTQLFVNTTISTTGDEYSLASFERDSQSGILTPYATYKNGEDNIEGLETFFLAISDDNKHLYTNSWVSGGVAIFRITEVPSPAEGLLATAGETSITLDWNAHIDQNVTAYHVYRNTINDPYTSELLSEDLTSVTYEDFTASEGTEYFYWIIAETADGVASNFSTHVSALIEVTTGLFSADHPLSSIKVYPNPASEFIHISSRNKDLMQVEIATQQGNIVSTHKLDSTNNTIDVSLLTDGVYFLKVFNADFSEVIKLVKN